MYSHITLLHLHFLLGILGAYTPPPLLCYFVYKTAHAFSREAHQLQPSDFYNPALALALSQ
jgi:hypothetical protein